MIIKPLYKYTRPDGGESVSPIAPECEYITLYRLIADEGMALQKDGGEWQQAVDVDDVEGWVEGIPVEPQEEEKEPEEPKELVFLLPPTDPKSLMLNEVDYLEWQNLKKKMAMFEQEMAIVSLSFASATEVLKKLEEVL